MPPSLWTEDQDAILKAQWPTGKSASHIACLIPGKSRNAIIGRAHRMKLGKRLELSIKDVAKQTPGSGKNKTARKRNRKKGGSTPHEGIMKKLNAPMRIPQDRPLTTRPPITIMELTDGKCKAVVGRAGPPHYLAVYCGDDTFAGNSFCEGHCAIYFNYEARRRYRS